MSGYNLGRTQIIHKDDFAYTSHPSITVLRDGAGGIEWLAAFSQSRRRQIRMHPPTDPLFRTLLARTKDNGETWEAPSFAPDFEWYGTETPGIAQLNDGKVVLAQFRFSWYPLALAKERRAQKELISINLPEKGWTEDFKDEDWNRSVYTWARGYHGLYTHLSRDLGYTFYKSVKLDCAPYRDGFTRTGVVELSDGRCGYAVTEHPVMLHPRYNRRTYILYSQDNCQSWDAPIFIVDDQDMIFGEPHIAEVAPGEIYCILRESLKTFYLYGCRSTDGGRTWSRPTPTSMWGCPGHLLMLQDGCLLCTYGRRKAPFGIRACLSEDGGRSWNTDQQIIIRDDLPNGDLGYPTTIEYEPGRLFICYYGQENDGITCVQGTYVDLY